MNMTTGESRKSLKKKKHLSSSSSFKIWVPNQQKNNSRNKIKPWRISDTYNSRKWNILMELDYNIEEKKYNLSLVGVFNISYRRIFKYFHLTNLYIDTK